MNVLNINGPGSVNSANWLACNFSYPNQYTMLNIATWNSSFNFGTPSGGSYGIYEDFGLTNIAPSSSTSGFGGNWSGLSNRYGISGSRLTSNGYEGSTFTSGPQSWILSVYLNGLTNEIVGLGNYASGFNISGMAYNLGSGSQYYTQSSVLWVGYQYIFFYFFDTSNSLTNIVFIRLINLPSSMPTLQTSTKIVSNQVNIQVNFLLNTPSGLTPLYITNGNLYSNFSALNTVINGQYSYSTTIYTSATSIYGTLNVPVMQAYYNNQYIYVSCYGLLAQNMAVNQLPYVYSYNSNLNYYTLWTNFTWNNTNIINGITLVYNLTFVQIQPYSFYVYPYGQSYNINIISEVNTNGFSTPINYVLSATGNITLGVFSQPSSSTSQITFSISGINYPYIFYEYQYYTNNTTYAYYPGPVQQNQQITITYNATNVATTNTYTILLLDPITFYFNITNGNYPISINATVYNSSSGVYLPMIYPNNTQVNNIYSANNIFLVPMDRYISFYPFQTNNFQFIISQQNYYVYTGLNSQPNGISLISEGTANYTYTYQGQFTYSTNIFSFNIYGYKLYNITFSNLNYSTGSWNLSIYISTYTLPSFYKTINQQNITLQLPNVFITYQATYMYLQTTNYTTTISSDSIINISFNITLTNSSTIFVNYITNGINISQIQGSITFIVINQQNGTIYNITGSFGQSYYLIANYQFSATAYLNISYNALSLNGIYIGVNWSNANYSINNINYPISGVNIGIWFNYTTVFSLTLSITYIYLLNFTLNNPYGAYYVIQPNATIYVNNSNSLYILSYSQNIPLTNSLQLPIYTSGLNLQSFYTFYMFSGIYNYTIVPSYTMNFNLAYLGYYNYWFKIYKGTINLNQNTTISILLQPPNININFINLPSNVSIPITIYTNLNTSYSINSSNVNCPDVVYSGSISSNFSLIQNSTNELTNLNYYMITISSFTYNNVMYYPMINNITTEYGDLSNIISNITYGFSNATYSFYIYISENTTLTISFSQAYFISVSVNGFHDYYMNITIFNGQYYLNNSIIVNQPYISLPFWQNVYYQIQFQPLDNNYIILPSYVSGYLSTNINYTIVFVYQPSAPSQQINSTVPAPYNFNWIIPNFTIYGYTSDYIFALSFIAFLIGISAYVSYKSRSQMLGIGIILIGTFLLYIVNLIPLWVFVILGILLIVYYLYSKRGENI
ncbi:MAG: hypothetical protein QXU79_03845 [Candidatus Micrarchaeaceae archaeon]